MNNEAILLLKEQGLRESFELVNLHGVLYLAVKYGGRIIGYVNEKNTYRLASPFMDDTTEDVQVLDTFSRLFQGKMFPESAKEVILYAKGLLNFYQLS